MNQRLPKPEKIEKNEYHFGSVKFTPRPSEVGSNAGQDSKTALDEIKKAIENNAFSNEKENDGNTDS